MLPTCSGSAGSSFSLACIASTSSCTRSIDLKYLTVLTFNSARSHVEINAGEASGAGTYRQSHPRPRRSVPRGGSEAQTGSTGGASPSAPRRTHIPAGRRTKWLTPFSIAWLSASALRWPVTTTTTSRLSSTVCTPTVSAMRGTRETSFPKKRAFARIVSYASVLMRVRDDSDEPGSLNAMCPSSPMPPRKSSTPPNALIFASYALHSPIRSLALPFRMLTCDGGMSTGWRDVSGPRDV